MTRRPLGRPSTRQWPILGARQGLRNHAGSSNSGQSRTPHKGSTELLGRAISLPGNLEPCFTPVESPESNGVAEAFVKTFKRDYVKVSAISDAATALATVDDWINDLQRSPPTPQTGLLLTKGIHQRSIATCRLSGLTGSTPTWTGGPTERATCIRMITALPSTGSRSARFSSFQANACLSVMESRSR
jgi:hypothetical protein